jgi:hypothetical protein
MSIGALDETTWYNGSGRYCHMVGRGAESCFGSAALSFRKATMRKTDTNPTPKKEKKVTAMQQVNAATNVLQRLILAQLADLETRVAALEKRVREREHGTEKHGNQGE